MSERLDALVARLAAATTDRSLDNLEVEIGRTIVLRRREAQTTAALTPVRVASIGLAMAIGVTAGGAVATVGIVAPRAYGAFSIAGHLAPSTLLESGE